MTHIVIARIALLLAGVAVWGWGYRTDDANIRLAGIAIMVVALALRFFSRRPPRDTPPDP